MSSRNAPRLTLEAVCCALLVATGCGGTEGDSAGIPVSGKVLIEGEPLTTQVVVSIAITPVNVHTT